MTNVRTSIQENEKIADSINDIVLDSGFKKKVTTKFMKYKKNNPNLNTVELNYCLCWGFARKDELAKFVEDTKKTIENINFFIDQENKSGKNSYQFTLKVRLFPNEIDTDVVKECNNLAKDLLRDLEKKEQLIHLEKWRITNARTAAKISFDEYFKNDVRKQTINRLLEQDSLNFMKNHDVYTQEHCIKHLTDETLDVLALMNPKKDNLNTSDVKKLENTFIFVLSEHRLCDTTYYVINNADYIGYEKDAFCALAVLPKRLETEVRRDQSKLNIDRQNNNLIHSATELKSVPINITVNQGNKVIPNKNKSSPRSKHALFQSNQSISNAPSPYSERHRSHSPSSSSSSNDPSPNGSRTSSPGVSRSPQHSYSPNSSPPPDSPRTSKLRITGYAIGGMWQAGAPLEHIADLIDILADRTDKSKLLRVT